MAITMPISSHSTIKRFFKSGFTAKNIAEPLLSLDCDKPSAYVREFMQERDLDLIGIRRDGEMWGYVKDDDLKNGVCRDHAHLLSNELLIDEEVPLHLVIPMLDESGLVFLMSLGTVGGVIRQRDVEKPITRMWLFGMITILEVGLTRIIEMEYPDQSWKSKLPANRLSKALDLQAQRLEKGQFLRLLDCLHLADKGHIIALDTDLRERLRLGSRTNARRTITQVERLRNNLAHAHSLLPDNWEMIVKFSIQIEGLLKMLDI